MHLRSCIIRLLTMVLFLAITSPVSAQVWQTNVTAGSSLGRIFPSQIATKGNAETRYPLMGTGAFCSGTVQLRSGIHHGFSLQGQLAITPVGIRHTPKYIVGPVTRATDQLFSRSLTLGYSWHSPSEHSRIHVVTTARAGISYTTLAGLRLSSSSGLVEQYGGYGASTAAIRITGREIMEASLSPIVGATFLVGPHLPGTLSDRLSLSLSTNAMLRNPYISPSEVSLSYAANQSQFGAIVRYSGAVLMCQIGVDYVLFRQRDRYA